MMISNLSLKAGEHTNNRKRLKSSIHKIMEPLDKLNVKTTMQNFLKLVTYLWIYHCLIHIGLLGKIHVAQCDKTDLTSTQQNMRRFSTREELQERLNPQAQMICPYICPDQEPQHRKNASSSTQTCAHLNDTTL